MSRRHNDKDDVSEIEEDDDETEFAVNGLTYDVNFDGFLSDFEDDEEEPWFGRSRLDARDRLRQMRDMPVAHDDSGDNWDDDW